MSYSYGTSKIPCKCPIGHGVIGARQINEIIKLECHDCKYWAYIFSPKLKNPKPIDLRKDGKKCNCGRHPQ